MCLAVPGRVVSVTAAADQPSARVSFGGVLRDVALDFLPDTRVGDYVMVHVGFAISRVDAAEARRTFRMLTEAGLLGAELGEPDVRS